ncbi:DUF2252 family protein [Sphingomonas oryzagri]|uniref:DUF2252 family protein n=1 Tax=Sphingomonas oryzagri TaxID=3042314 RepID=A0ABT6MW50_9SPHN|nr:DUF2252 family protein [Sphingomonas oryzagri]MDH7637245.1 DUF2252 family protein [Sphingomonas oryzagri]
MSVSPDERRAILDRTRALKMARSVHAYVRGNTAQFYEWLENSSVAELIPSGPAIWICGDCHLGNLGPLADADRRVDIQIRDLDQAVIGNPAHDLIRLGLSLETAARSADLPGVTTARMIEAMIDGYSQALGRTEGKHPMEPAVVRSVRRKALGRRWHHLARERLEDVEPKIPYGKRFWKLTDREWDAIEALFGQPEIVTRALDLAGLEKGSIRVIDAAYWRKGCSSLGKLRYAVILGVKAKGGKRERLALVDIKEAVPSVAPVDAGARMPDDPAERVVAGARALAPNLGERMIPAQLLSKPVVLRELTPQDLKIEVEQFSRREAIAAAEYLAYIVGLAHAHQMPRDQRHMWSDRLTRRPDGKLDAPSWLWRSVVILAGKHEAGYLDHCRRFALET